MRDGRRSSPFSGDDDVEGAGEPHVTVVRSPRSRGSFLSLGDFEQQLQLSVRRARPAVLAAAAAAASTWPGGALASPSSSMQQVRRCPGVPQGAASAAGLGAALRVRRRAGVEASWEGRWEAATDERS